MITFYELTTLSDMHLICVTDRPIVLYELTRDLPTGSIDRWSSMR